MTYQEDLERKINETKEQIESAEAHAERSRERLEQLKRERRAAAGPSLSEFKEMTASERRELREEDPDTWRDLMDRRAEEGQEALRSTSPGFLGG